MGPAPTIRVINSLLGACVRQNNLKKAQELFSSLTGVRGGGFAAFVTPATEAGVCVAIQPDEFSFNIMVNAYARAKQVCVRSCVVCVWRWGGGGSEEQGESVCTREAGCQCF